MLGLKKQATPHLAWFICFNFYCTTQGFFFFFWHSGRLSWGFVRAPQKPFYWSALQHLFPCNHCKPTNPKQLSFEKHQINYKHFGEHKLQIHEQCHQQELLTAISICTEQILVWYLKATTERDLAWISSQIPEPNFKSVGLTQSDATTKITQHYTVENHYWAFIYA